MHGMCLRSFPGPTVVGGTDTLVPREDFRGAQGDFEMFNGFH